MHVQTLLITYTKAKSLIYDVEALHAYTLKEGEKLDDAIYEHVGKLKLNSIRFRLVEVKVV